MTDTTAGEGVVIPRSVFDACMSMAKEYAPLSIAPHLSKALAAQPSAGAQGEAWSDWQARYMVLYQRLHDMADRWDKAVFDHSLEPTFGDDYDQTENRRALFDCRPLADFENATPEDGGA